MAAEGRLAPARRWLALAAIVVALCSLTDARALAGCVYGPDGSVIHRSNGSDCRNVVRSDIPEEHEYAKPVLVPDGEWIPLSAGTERLYDIVIRRGYSPFDQPEDVREYEGTQHFELVPAPERMGEGAFEKRVTTRIGRDPTQLAKTGLQRFFLRKGEGGVELLASNRYWFGKRRDIEYVNGARVLPNELKAKLQWHAGSISDQDMRIEQRGRVLGLQDLRTSAGHFPKCLVVQYVSDISGAKADLYGRPAIRGRITKQVWYARGIGVVRSVEKGKLETYVNGDHFAFSADDELTLKGIRGRVLPASLAER